MSEQAPPSWLATKLPLLLLIIGAVATGAVSNMANDNLIDEVPWWPTVLATVCILIPTLLWRRWLIAQPKVPEKQRSVGVVVAAALIAMFGGRSAFVALNTALDTQLRVVEAKVLHKQQERVQRGTSTITVYYVTIDVELTSEAPGEWILELPVSVYARTIVGDTLDVRVGSGRFGIRYVDDIAVHRRPIDPNAPASAAAAIGMPRQDR